MEACISDRIAEASVTEAGPNGPPGAAAVSLGVARCGDLHLGIPIEHLAEVARIDDLRPIAQPSDHLLGAIDLRGRLVPVIDVSGLAMGRASSGATPPFAAILRADRRLIAIGVDEIDGMVNVAAGAIARAARGASPSEDARTAPALIQGDLLHEGRVLTILDAVALLNRTATLSVPEPGDARGPGAPSDAETAGLAPPGADQDRLLIFSCGGAELALRATEIQGTVPRTVIEENALTSGICLGSIDHHRQRIPVLRTQMLTGLGEPSDNRHAEIVLLRVDDRQRIGLAVDRIERMMTMASSSLHPVPAMIAQQSASLEGILPAQGTHRQVFLLSLKGITGTKTIKELGKLSVRDVTAPKTPPNGQPGKADVIRESIRYLVFQAGTQLAAPAAQVLRIIEPPEVVTPCEEGGPGMVGIFQFDNRPALFVDLARRLGLHQQRTAAAAGRVLVVSHAGQLIGFGVDSVDGIETSAWRRIGTSGRDKGTIVQLGRSSARRILPVLDLTRLAAAQPA